MRYRVLAAAVVTVLTTFQILRNVVVQGDEPMELSSLLWPHHPNVLKSVAMREVGEAAAARQVPSEATIHAFHELATNAPRAPEPFLVVAAMAVKEGDISRGQRLLLHALRRDPRSTAGRFLLADLYLSSGRAVDGLAQLALLTRRIPRTAVPLAAALQQFARNGGTAAQLRQLFVINPALEDQVLSTLASDGANADLIVAAASKRGREDDAKAPAWQGKLLNAMIARREYQKAYQIWLRLARIPQGAAQTIYNPGYRITSAPPPFNWTLSSGSAGVAEGENGNLQVTHYGTANATLAKQLLILPPGTYQLGMSVNGTVLDANQLIWSITCLPSRKQVLHAGIRADAGPLRADFEIPSGSCDAQELVLKGRAQEPVKAADVRLGPIRLKRTER